MNDGRQRLGRAGEAVAAEHLVRRGFSILERNYRTRWGELDIVAFDGQTMVFCEVKARQTRNGRALDGSGPAATGPGRPRLAEAPPLDSVHPRKQRQVRRMAGSWLGERANHPYAAAIRFDAIGVIFDRAGRLVSLEHLEGAF